MRKKQKKGRRRQKIFGALALITGLSLIILALLDWRDIYPAAAELAAILPEQATILISPASIAVAGTVLSFGGLAALLGLCGCCAMCLYSGIDQSALIPIRTYRDQVLKRSWYGRVFVWLYYNILSPAVILSILMLPFKSWKRKIGLWTIPRLSNWCKRRVKDDGG